jgi:hypothetical protein
MDATQFRNLVKQVSDKDISSEQAQHFLSIFQEDLNADLAQTTRNFVIRHFGSKSQASKSATA